MSLIAKPIFIQGFSAALLIFAILSGPSLAQTTPTETPAPTATPAPGVPNWVQLSLCGPDPRLPNQLAYEAPLDQVIDFGGKTDSQIVDDVWDWNGTTWVQGMGTLIPARVGAGMVYDSGNDMVVLFGGGQSDGTVLNDTWLYRGLSWIPGPTQGPSARDGIQLAYDSGRGKTVLFGGYNGNADLSDTWEWDGTAWNLAIIFSGPTGRSGYAAAYDPIRGKTVLFGGDQDQNDTWVWDGSAWTQEPAPGPEGRAFSAMAFLPRWGGTILFGGETLAGVLETDTWSWDGSAWTLLTGNSPGGRVLPGLATDTLRSRLILFGGEATGGAGTNDTWELLPPSPVETATETPTESPTFTPSPTPTPVISGTSTPVCSPVSYFAGWNSLGFPSAWLTPTPPRMADFITTLKTDANVTVSNVATWGGVGWTIHSAGSPANNLSMIAGKGYLYFVKEGHGTWTYCGLPFAQGAAFTLNAGWNFVSLECYAGMPAYSASTVSASLNGFAGAGTCQNVAEWGGTGWKIYTPGLPVNNFGLNCESGYFIRVSKAVAGWTP